MQGKYFHEYFSALNSKFVTFPLLLPYYQLHGNKICPSSVRVWDRISPVSQIQLIQRDSLSPCSVHRAFLDTIQCAHCAIVSRE